MDAYTERLWFRHYEPITTNEEREERMDKVIERIKEIDEDIKCLEDDRKEYILEIEEEIVNNYIPNGIEITEEERVEIINEEEIPDEFMRKTPNYYAIKNHYKKTGEIIPGTKIRVLKGFKIKEEE